MCIEGGYSQIQSHNYYARHIYYISTILYCIVQNIRGSKLLWLSHHVSIRRKTFAFASKQCPQAPKHFEIRGKTFVVQAKTVKTVQVLVL